MGVAEDARLIPARTAALAALLAAVPARAATVKLIAYDAKGRTLGLSGLLARLGRADEADPRDPAKAAVWAFPTDDKSPPVRVKLDSLGPVVTATWPGGPARLELVWPVTDDGFSDVWADDGGAGFSDGAAVFLDEAIAQTQWRLFKDSWKRRTTDWQPLYEPGRKAKDLYGKSQAAMEAASGTKEGAKRAAAFEDALHEISLAWEKALFEHGLQLALDARAAKDDRFGLTLDDSILKRLDDLDWIAEAVERSGTNWVRLVFRPNGTDFEYASLRSFNEYDGIVAELRKRKINVMGDVLDTAQWPRKLTPEAYAERVKNLVLHYKGRISSWEVGPELNGDWLGGASDPLSCDAAFKIYAAGAAKVKELDPEAEVVATLYWWEATAPDRAHSLSGWLKARAAELSRTADVVGLEVFPEDNPAGLALERAFDAAADALPKQRLMLSSFGYVEGEKLKGYWWLAPDDVDGGRKDLVILYTTASCAMTRSLCGGFWWQALDQMLPVGHHRATDLYKIYRRTTSQLGRK